MHSQHIFALLLSLRLFFLGEEDNDSLFVLVVETEFLVQFWVSHFPGAYKTHILVFKF
jgi:hypothetical protein